MKNYDNIDYSENRDKRRKVARYLYVGSLQQGAYKRDLDYNVKRNRLFVVLFALFIILMGLYSLFF